MPWYQEVPKENVFVPSPRCNSAIVVAQCPEDFDNPEGKRVPIVVVFGGDADGQPTDEAFRYDVGTKQWLRSPFSPMRDSNGKTSPHDRPPAVSRHSMVLKSDARTVIVFGGVGPGNKINHHVYAFDAVKFQCKKVLIQGQPGGRMKADGPLCTPLYGHTAVVYEDDMYVFGGRDMKQKYNDVWRLATNTLHETWTWQLLDCSGTKPAKCVRHTAVCQGVNMVCTGGDMDNSIYVLRLGINLNFWSVVDTHGFIMPPLSGAQAAILDQSMVLMGGVNKDDRQLNPTLFCLNLNTMEWSIDESGGMQPDGRVQHAVATFGSQFFMFGGENKDHEKLGDLFRFDGRKLAWTEIETDGHSPPARCGHQAVFIGLDLYVVGGAGGGLTFIEVFKLDTRTNEWKRLEGRDTGMNSVPAVLLGHTVEAKNNRLWVFGGGASTSEGSKKAGNQLRTFFPDKTGGEWRIITDSKGSIPPPMLGQVSGQWGNRMYIFGGFIESKGYSADMYSYEFSSNTWIMHQPGGSVPDGRVGHAFAIFRNFGICFGGSAKAVHANHVHVIDMKKMMWTSLICGGSVPRSRHSMAFSLVPNGPEDANLWIFGGRTDIYGRGEVLADTYNLRLNSRAASQETWVWESINTAANSPPQSSAASFSELKGVLFMFGGDTGGTFTNRLYNLDPSRLLDTVPIVKKKVIHKPKRKRRQRKIVIALPEEPPEPPRPAKSMFETDDLFQDFQVFTPSEKDAKPLVHHTKLLPDKETDEDVKGKKDPDLELIEDGQHDVLFWLKAKGLTKHAEAFNTNEIDLASLVLLENRDLVYLGVNTYGERNNILTMLRTLRDKYERYLVSSDDFHINPLARHIFAKTKRGKTYQMVDRINIAHSACLRLLEAKSGNIVVAKAFKNEEAFAREVKNHEKYSSSGVVADVIDSFQDETLTSMMVFDGGGGSLAMRLKTSTPTYTECRQILEDIISCIEFFHSKKLCLVHVDPGNFVFTQHGSKALLFDATALFIKDGEMLLFPPDEIHGTTCMVMPPEVATRSFLASENPGAELTMKPRGNMDMWGLGVLLAQMYGVGHLVHGVVGNPGQDQPALSSERILKTICNFVPSVIAHANIVDKHAQDLMMKLLTMNPKERMKVKNIRQHPFFTSVGEGESTKLFNSVVVKYEGMHFNVDDMNEKTDNVIELQRAYGGKKIRIRTDEELKELKEEIEKEMQIHADLARGARRRAK